ncbi:MAG: M14 family metallopeptidase [Bacteroidales bacterium]|nr:M14 family metallopeptidase [Bacteroidales bacterium]
MRTLSIFIAFMGFLHFVNAQEKLLTTAELTDYQKTSTYREVMDFLKVLEESSPYARLTDIAKTTEGREVPLLIIGNPLPKSPEELKNDKRIVVYLQGNIHAGEVEGKEATQMLARDLLKTPGSEILKNVIVLVNPILNPDGNEKFSPKNRTNQNGPASVGVRYNGQMLDLNRDAMKLETPEIRGVVQNVLNKWDPAISVDCHTTNGSYHEEPTTFVWQMNPNGNRNLINYMRDEMMPKVHRTLWDKYDVENIFYGEFINRMDYSKGWISYAAEPRFLVNYIGLRNRLAILNENYVYADFKTRVNASYHLLLSILEYASKHKKEIKELIEKADNQAINSTVSDSFAIKYEGQPTPEKITIKAIEADTIPGAKGYWRYKQSDRKVTVIVPYIADYFSTQSVKIPYAYLLTIADPEIAVLLKRHGIKVEQLEEPAMLLVEEFKISKLKAAQRLFQGHYTNTISGEYYETEIEFPAGTYIVFSAQPLGKLATYLLEPQSNDGLLKWNYFDRYLVPQWGRGFYAYPVARLMKQEIFTTK